MIGVLVFPDFQLLDLHVNGATREASVAQKKDADQIDPIRQLACVIAIYALRDVPSDEAAIRLDQIGFGAKEIGGILGKNDNYVHMVKNARKKK